MRVLWLIPLMLLSCYIITCKRAETQKQTPEKGASAMTFTIETSAFKDGATIPKKFTCDGEDISPPLSWNGAPEGTQSFALICDDPDAPMGTWVHWVLWGLPPDTMGLLEDVPTDSALAGGSKQGLNSWPHVGYGGPCPPPGKPHRYYFKLYALDAMLALPLETNKAQLMEAMKDHILAEAQVMGTYGR